MKWRHHAAALIGALAAIAMVVTAAPVASAAPAAAPATPLNAGAADAADDGSAAFDDLRELINRFAADGDVTARGATRLLFLVDFAQHYYDWVGCAAGRVALVMEEFKRYATDPRWVPSEPAQDQLVAAADRLLVQLCGTPGDQR